MNTKSTETAQDKMIIEYTSTKGRREMNKSYYAIDRDFSNRFCVYAFASRADRDNACEATDTMTPITRKEARKCLGRSYLSPNDQDLRTSCGCYVGSANEWEEERRVFEESTTESRFDGICNPAIRL